MELTDAYFDAGEIRLHYMEGPPTGPPLILMHGATGNWETWFPLLPRITEQWHVFALDLHGHGQSGWANNREGYHVLHNISDILAFLRGRVKNPAVLVGHSWGGVIALLCGARGKEHLRGLVLEDPPLLIRRPNVESKPFLEYFSWVYQIKQRALTLDDMRAAILAANPEEIPTEILDPKAKRIAAVDPDFLLAVLAGSEVVKGVDFKRSIQEIACPILLLQADPAKNCALVQEEIDLVLQNAIDALLFRFLGAGHVIHDDQPDKFLKTLNFFEFNPPSSSPAR